MILIPIIIGAIFTAVAFKEPAPVSKTTQEIYKEAREGIGHQK